MITNGFVHGYLIGYMCKTAQSTEIPEGTPEPKLDQAWVNNFAKGQKDTAEVRALEHAARSTAEQVADAERLGVEKPVPKRTDDEAIARANAIREKVQAAKAEADKAKKSEPQGSKGKP
jgi:hypothetical protein